MSAHTPGPWRATPYSSIVGIAVSGSCGVIAGIRGDKPTAEANARLVVAAPDLLTLAKQFASECAECGGAGALIVGHHSAKDGTRPCDQCADIRAVIDKAEGRA